MLNDSTIRKSIIASIIASLLVIIFIKPLLDSLWSFVSWFSTYCYAGFNNSVYRNAALGQRDWVSVLHIGLFISVLCGTLSGFTIVIFILKQPESKVVEKIKKKRKSLRWLIVLLLILLILTFLLKKLGGRPLVLQFTNDD